jgi:cell division protein FtsB
MPFAIISESWTPRPRRPVNHNYVAKQALKKRLKKVIRTPRLLLITGVLTVLAATLLFANKGLWRHMSLRHEINERKGRMAELAAQEEVVNRHIALLRMEDNSTIERIARERYNMKRPGETIYREQ